MVLPLRGDQRLCALRDRLRRLSPPLWAAVTVLALFLSACQIRQEIRFNPDGSGTASVTVGISKTCWPPGAEIRCSERAERLLAGEGPVANAEKKAERLPFDVRIEPFEGNYGNETGYTLSFDFASPEDLQQKLATDPTTGRSQTSALVFSGMTFEPNGDGGFTFTAEVSPVAGLVPGSYSPDAPDSIPLAVVLPGMGVGEHNADVAEDAEGGTRFRWNFEPTEEWPAQLTASTCSRGACGSSPLIPAAVAAGLVVVVLALGALLRRRGGATPLLRR